MTAPATTTMTAAAINPRRSSRRGAGLGMAPMVVRVPASRAWTGPGGAGAAVRAIMAPVVEEDPDVLLTRLARLPAAGALLGRFAATPTDVYLVGARSAT